ncbi:DUF2325 domain-containing protein [Roseococcus sp.]|uniref:DUF2325 domain-containing protein n=1 Tax=Roseococcus sp. TaxID=2109646 RepID=UPI003BAAC9D4
MSDAGARRVLQEACDCAIRLPGRPAPALPALAAFLANAPPPSVAVSAPAPTRRRRIWDLAGTFHCSIVGTCLSADELRRLLRKLDLVPAGASDHDLHGRGVGLGSKDDHGGKLLNKALDERHSGAIHRFAAARDVNALRALWREAQEAGDIPGAYWAVLTHPALDDALTREAFGAVHMLSHLVGAANRADIRRLVAQDRELAEQRETIQRQQARMQELVEERTSAQEALATRRLVQVAAPPPEPPSELQRRLEAAEQRAAALEARRSEAEAKAEAAERRAVAAEAQVEEARRRAAEAEAGLALLAPGETPGAPAASLLGTVLYVGGRPSQVPALREGAARLGVALIHHDGGVEESGSQLPGLVRRAELVVFPVDCVSHEAVWAVKRICRAVGRPYRPLRSSGMSSFLAALTEQGRPSEAETPL